ncbi:MAG: glutathione S-transferase family protein [Kiloniellales bacterium]|nr:glutathione S-transferase family protein [Kiloniellales bacterium]
MGKLVEGIWRDEWYDTKTSGGRFRRSDSAFRDWVTADGGSGFKAEPGRYHLYVSLACPWAHRTLIFRRLKRLEEVISVDVVHWHMAENGWSFGNEDGDDAVTGDRVLGKDFLHQVYTAAKADYTGRVTVPVLWDKQRGTIVSNESSEIIRMLNAAFDQWGDGEVDFYPEALRAEIDAVNEPIYHRVNNGVYKAGFATTQAAYDQAFAELFETLDELEARLGRQRYLVGDRITEADWRLFTTLLRFDPVYHGHFKCNLRRLVDYPNLWAYTRELYQVPGIAETVNLHHIVQHYYASHLSVNPTGIVPRGPEIDFMAPHGRG